jgi:tetratricopeptide (TPR) repeat protein
MRPVFQKIKAVFFRAGVLYFLSGVLFYQIVDWHKLQIRELNELKIPIDYLVYFSKNKVPFDESKFHDHLQYYEKLCALAPRYPEALGMLGFCHYYLGNEKKAIYFFEAAAKENPQLFWFTYNLGLIYYQRKEFEKAISYFMITLGKNLFLARELPRRSLIYINLDLPNENADGITPDIRSLNMNNFIDENLNEALLNCYRLIILSYQALNNYPAVVRVSQLALDKGMSGKAIFYYYLGVGAFQLKQYENAARVFQKCVELNPRFQDAYRWLGLCYRELKNPNLAQIFEQGYKNMRLTAPESDEQLKVDLMLKIF